MNLIEANKLWYKFEPIEGVLFGYNDNVLIKSGNHAAKNASVISLESLQPTTYLLELGSGDGDIVIAETELEKNE